MDKYLWDLSMNEFPVIDAHSLTKHEVVKEYLLTYLVIVGGHPYPGKLIINLVDGFAGGGLYKKRNGELHDGSPLIFINTVKEAEVILSAEKDYRISPRFYFVEKNKLASQFLKKYLAEKVETKFLKKINIFNNTFENKYKSIVKDIKRRGRAHRAIFLLDQYGYSQVTIKSINYIFNELPKAEIILTFNVDSLIDYMSNSDHTTKILNKLNLDYDLSNLSAEKAQKRWRTKIQFKLFEEFRKQVNAKYISNLFIKSSKSTRSYWLMHLSMIEIAKNEMEKIHWEFKNHFVSETSSGLKVFTGYDPEKDFNLTKQHTLRFTDEEKKESKLNLYNEIPQYLSYKKIPAREFYLQHINDTPATKEMIYDTLEELYVNKVIEITNKSGSKKRKNTKIKDEDLIRLPLQKIFNFKPL